MAKIINADALEWLRLDQNQVKCIFADIVDNLGLKYNGYDDRMNIDDYYRWVKLLILEVLPKCKIFWLTYNPIHELEITTMIRDILKFRHPSFRYDKFLWTYTFSQYNDHDCSYGYRPLVRLKSPSGMLYPDKIREVSVRQELGDARAAGKRVPSNVWSIPRVVGNSPERCEHMPTQMPIRLMERIISFSFDPVIDINPSGFVDLFGGSGSSIIAAQNLGKGYFDNTTVIEIDKFTCQVINNHRLMKQENRGIPINTL